VSLSRAQKVTLALGVPLTVALIGWGGLNAVAAVGRGSEQVSMQVPVTSGKVAVSLGAGDLTLQAGSGSTAALTGTIRYSLFPPRPHQATGPDGTTTISFDCTSVVGWCSMASTLFVPATVTDARLATDTGSITVNGGPQRTLDLSSSMGEIRGTGLSASDVTAHSAMGNISLTFARPPRTLTVTDSMGDISIVLPAGTHYRLVDVHSDMGTVNDSTVHSYQDATILITATTSMGDVNITMASS
jgi:Putative adhesin